MIAKRIEQQVGVLEDAGVSLSETARMMAVKSPEVMQTALKLAMHGSRLLGQAAELRKISSSLAADPDIS